MPFPLQPHEASRLLDFGPPAAPRPGADQTAVSIVPWNWLAPVLLGALALAVRLPNLDHVALIDELYHFLPAQAWLADGQLRIAEGTYERTAPFTIFLAQWLGLFGENLTVARLPSLIAGVALVVLLFLWTRAVAGNLAAVLAALLLALDPEAVQISQFARFYALHGLLFWLGAVGTYRLVTAPPALGRSMLVALGIVVGFGAALYLQVITFIGLLGVAVWSVLALGLAWLPTLSPRARWGGAIGVALVGGAVLVILMESGLAAELLARYRSTPVFQAEHRDDFWYYHGFLVIYYPSLWPLTALAVGVGLAYRPRPMAFCASVVAVAFVLHSFAGPKAMRYFAYAQPFLFVVWGIALAEILPRLRAFLEEVGTLALARLHLERLGRPGVFAALAVALGFAVVANGAPMRTMANVFDIVIPPMRRAADWAAARDELAPWLADAPIVLTTSELEALYHLGRYDVLISRTRQSELHDREEFAIDPRTGRPVIATPESLALIMDCYLDGLIVSTGPRWRDPAGIDDAVANLIEATAEEVELVAFDMKAYVWQQPDDARRAEACARLPADMADGVMAGLGGSGAP